MLSGQCLDNGRLNKQLVECQQILNCLVGKTSGSWRNHPAVRMWEDNVDALTLYAEACMTVWLKRKRIWHKLSDWDGQHRSWDAIYAIQVEHDWHVIQPAEPAWLGDERLHSSHRCRLLHKGNLDRARLRARLHVDKSVKLDVWLKQFFNSSRKLPLRDLTVAQCDRLHQYFDDNQVQDYDNWYEQFNWREQPSDDYHWPVELLS